jgi:hypothetical protein
MTHTKILIGLGVLIAIGGILFYTLPAQAPRTGSDYKNATYLIGGRAVTLAHGVESHEVAPGSASLAMTRVFGNELFTDLDGDGKDDVAFILESEPGGSGVFYYLVGALSTPTGYVGTEGYLLGDRIAPQPITTSPNPRHVRVIVANYATRAPGEPMAARPTVGTSVYLKLDPATRTWGIVVPDFEGESAR